MREIIHSERKSDVQKSQILNVTSSHCCSRGIGKCTLLISCERNREVAASLGGVKMSSSTTTPLLFSSVHSAPFQSLSP